MTIDILPESVMIALAITLPVCTTIVYLVQRMCRMYEQPELMRLQREKIALYAQLENQRIKLEHEQIKMLTASAPREEVHGG